VTPPLPAPSPVETTPPASAASASMLTGTVEFRIWPYATVFVDGRRVGETPLKPLELSEGRHVLKFVNTKLAKTVLQAIDLQPGQHLVIKSDLSAQ